MYATAVGDTAKAYFSEVGHEKQNRFGRHIFFAKKGEQIHDFPLTFKSHPPQFSILSLVSSGAKIFNMQTPKQVGTKPENITNLFKFKMLTQSPAQWLNI